VFKRWSAVAAAVLLLAAATGGVLWWRAAGGTDLERAVALAPGGADRISWTDWAAVRDELGADVSASSSTDELTAFLDRGYEADLTSGSALLESAALLHERFGFSPASIDWELLSQSAEGAALTIQLAGSTDVEELGDRLEELGYERPDSGDDVWSAGPDLLASIGPELTPELQYVALDADERLLRASDTQTFLERALAGGGDQQEAVDEVVAATGEPLSAAVYTGSHACQALAMSSADPADQAQAEQLVREAGEVNPVTGFAMSAQPGGEVRVVLAFESEDQARANADSRSVLARGPAPGQGGDFADRFGVRSVTAEGDLVTLALEPREGEYVLSDLSTGPVLFATC
jgi:hypothetical protein